MKANDKHVVDFLTARCTYAIPVYQRNYDWKIENCKKLLDDIILAKENDLKEYFLGSFVTVQKSSSDRLNFYIIDGQQRLTSLTLLLLAIYHIDSNQKPTIDRMIFTDTQGKEKTLILKQIQKDETFLSQIINNNELPHKEDSNIINNYQFFYDFIIQDTSRINIILQGLNRLRFVHIELETTDQPQLVFETLNATGKELSEADKIRNFILMYEEQEHLYETYWVKIELDCLQHINQNSVSNFMKAFLTIIHRAEVTKPIKDNYIYETFKNFYEKSQKNNKDILILMREYSSCYNKILSPEKYDDSYIDLLKNIQELEVNVLNPLILCILKLEQDKIISSDTTKEFINMLENYLVRRRLSDIQSNALNKVAFALIHKLMSLSNELMIKTIFKETLLGLKGSARFPKDEEVFNKLEHRAIYTARSLGKFILKCLELNGSKEKNDFSDITIEHIMPQKLSPEWIKALGENYKDIHETYIHTLGNLTFTGYNIELGNKPFSEKYPILHNSKFHFLNEEFKKPINSWNETTIKQRTHRLTSAILTIYPFPDVATLYDSIDITDDMDFTYKEIVNFEYDSKRHDVRENTWANFMVDFCKLLYIEDPVLFQHSVIENSEFSNKISWEFRNSWTSIIIIDNRSLYINTVTDTNTKIRTLNKILEALDIIETPITLYIKSS